MGHYWRRCQSTPRPTHIGSNTSEAFLQGRAGGTDATSLSIHGPPLGRTSRDKEHKFALRGNGQLAIDTAHMGAHGTF